MARIVKAWPILASVLMFLAAFPPSPLGLLTFVALAPWLVSLKTTTPKESLKSGYLFGLLFMLAQMAWLFSLVYHWTGNLALALLPWILSGLVAAWYFAFAGWAINACWKRNYPWMIPLVWAGVEAFRSYVPGLAFPWGLAATPLTDYPLLIQTAHYGTIFLVSAWVVLANVIAAQIIAGASYSSLRTILGVWVVLLLASLVRYSDEPAGQKMRFAIGQPGVDMAFLARDQQQKLLADRVSKIIGYSRLSRPKFLLLPEGMACADRNIPPYTSFPIPNDMAIIFGGQRGGGPVFQTAYAYDGQWKYADKRRLVIFGEYVPGRNWIPLIDKFDLPSGDLRPSSQTKAFDVNGVRVGPMLCFEGLFSDVSEDQVKNGAQILTVMSIDDWYMGTAAPAQLRTGAIWRAVETGLPVLRAASLGHSLAIDARGRVLKEVPLREPRILWADLVVPSEPEPAGARPYVPLAFLASCLVAAYWAIFKPKRVEPVEEPSPAPQQTKKRTKGKPRKTK
jgi:apolipoprotein N-acyltransferase